MVRAPVRDAGNDMNGAAQPEPTLLQVEDLSKSFGATTVLRTVSLRVREGEILSLLGPSGCGKSTLLRVIAGLEQAEAGAVYFGERRIDSVPVHERGFGLMFQDFALFPHRTVGQNVAFGPRMQNLPRREIEGRVVETLSIVGLQGYANRTIFELSGGERQRVALARSLAARPRLLLLDEPLGALDRTLRERLTEDLRQILKAQRMTSIYVTHDQVEAFAVGDTIALMNAGEIVQRGTPAEVYQCPCSAFAARFLGLNNLVDARIVAHSPSTAQVSTALGEINVPRDPPRSLVDDVLLLVRPEAATIKTEDVMHVIQGTVLRRTFRGSSERVVLRHASGVELELDLPAGYATENQTITVGLRPEAMTLVPKS